MNRLPVPLASFTYVGELLKFLRRRTRLSQRELSIAVGYSESHISRIENNERSIDRASLLALFVPALDIESEPETIARLLALCEQEQPMPSGSRPASTLSQLVAHTLPEHHNRLPGQLTSFIGRREEMAELRYLLADRQTRLLTLTGAGGCGKTRLALRVGEELAQDYEHGGWLVEFASLSDPQLAPNVIASTFGLDESSDQSLPSVLTNFLRPRQTLLILDNCEHLVEAVAQLTEALLSACPRLQILATSREVLGVPGEIPFRVQPLALPPAHWGVLPSRAAVEGYDAIQLFVDRARTALRTFTLTDQNAPAVVRVCQRLDGLPLGIELAAAWVNLLHPEQIASRLGESFDFLMGKRRPVFPRHQTLRAAIEWSYNLLPEIERLLLRRLSVFEGGWMLDAAEAVTTAAVGGEASFTKTQVLNLLSQMVNKSLVTVDWSAQVEVRYRLLEPIQEYLREKLVENGDDEQLRDHHLDFFVTLAETAEPELKSHRQMVWLDRLDQEQDNLRAALSWSLSQKKTSKGLRLVGALGHFWEMRFNLAEGSRWCQAILAMANDESSLQSSLWRARALFVSGMIACYRYDLEIARRHLEESVTGFQMAGDPAGGAAALCFLGVTQDRLNESHQAMCTYYDGLQLAQRAEDAWWIAETMH